MRPFAAITQSALKKRRYKEEYYNTNLSSTSLWNVNSVVLCSTPPELNINGPSTILTSVDLF